MRAPQDEQQQLVNGGAESQAGFPIPTAGDLKEMRERVIMFVER